MTQMKQPPENPGRFKTYGEGMLSGVGQTNAEHIFCDQGGSLSGPDHQSRVMEQIKQYFDLCLSQIAKNQADYQTFQRALAEIKKK